MISVQVSYRMNPQFVAQNIANINTFLADFRKITGFRYDVFLKDDGLTFVHMSEYDDEAVQKQVLSVPSFLEFQRQRDASGLDGSHRVEIFQKIGSTI